MNNVSFGGKQKTKEFKITDKADTEKPVVYAKEISTITEKPLVLHLEDRKDALSVRIHSLKSLFSKNPNSSELRSTKLKIPLEGFLCLRTTT